MLLQANLSSFTHNGDDTPPRVLLYQAVFSQPVRDPTNFMDSKGLLLFYNSSSLVPIFNPINSVPTVPADLLKIKGKGKGSPRRAHEGPEKELRYSSTLSLTSTLGGGERTARGPGLFVPRKVTRYHLYRTLGGPQGRSGRVGKILPLPGFIRRTVQLVAIRYTD